MQLLVSQPWCSTGKGKSCTFGRIAAKHVGDPFTPSRHSATVRDKGLRGEDTMHCWRSAGRALIALLAAILQTSAWAGDEPSMSRAPGRVYVMTMNMYLGANVNPVFDALQNPRPPCLLPCVVARVWNQFLATNIAERVEAMARLIRIVRPDLIGLQEATLVR